MPEAYPKSKHVLKEGALVSDLKEAHRENAKPVN
jgi:hypothetical protein